MIKKACYAPLIESGIRQVSLAELKAIAVDSFAAAPRGTLFNGLLNWISPLHGFAIQADLWINGSFATTKPDPNDIDVVIIVKNSSADFGHRIREQVILAELFNYTYVRSNFNLDIAVVVRERPDSNKKLAFYRRLFGHQWDKSVKGIFEVKI